MKYFFLRNHTIEQYFTNLQASYSGYGDISTIDADADVVVWFYNLSFKASPTELLHELEDYTRKLHFVFHQESFKKRALIFLLDKTAIAPWVMTDRRCLDAIEDFNREVIQLCNEKKNIQYIDYSEFTRRYTPEQRIDWKFYYVSDMLMNPKLAKDFQQWFATQMNALQLKRKKCLILDCDNTLWGGVLGEDGIEGIQIGNAYPGNTFRDFQEHLVEAANNGVILVACSKNNEEDVLEAWEKNPYMVIGKKHFSAWRINWNNKAANIMELAEELNIGLDSMVFLDDNPAEREIVKQNIPELVVPDFPTQPYAIVPFFKEVYENYFKVYALTEEDKKKTGQYLENAQRNQFKKNFLNMDEYLESLEMELTVIPADSFSIARIAQMTQKTNQFNLTTKRYTEADIIGIVEQGGQVMALSVKDKFGDNGVTVLSIIKRDQEEALIDSFLLSCRILGRSIEKAFIHFLLNGLIDAGVKKIRANYIPTSKNKQTENFYEDMGFEVIARSDDGAKEYQMELKNKLEIKTYYQFKQKDER